MAEILGTPGNDELFGDINSDTLFGLEGDDTLLGLDGNDLIFGNQGADLLDGTEGDDTIFGGKDNDDITDIGNGNDLAFGNLGSDFINSSQGNDQIFGGQEDDFLIGGLGNDFVSGDKGNDILYGIDSLNLSNPGFGEIDTLSGGEGFDLFYIGSGAISYYVGLGDGDFALITDLNLTEDFIFVSGTDNLTFIDLSLGTFGTGTGIYSQTNDLIAFVQNANASQIDLNIIPG
jgi:Ca2+-binding RTX toxin-like protein